MYILEYARNIIFQMVSSPKSGCWIKNGCQEEDTGYIVSHSLQILDPYSHPSVVLYCLDYMN